MFFFVPFTNNIICGMRAQYVPFPSCKKRTVLGPVGLCYYKFSMGVSFPRSQVLKTLQGICSKNKSKGSCSVHALLAEFKDSGYLNVKPIK